jgi:hypothetical protein
MVSLAQKALALIVGIEIIVGKGPTGKAGRKALDTAARLILRSGPAAVGITRTAAPYAGRAALGIAAAPGIVPTVAGIAAYEAYQRGLLDPVGQALQFSARQAQESLMQPPGQFTTQALGLDGRGPIVGPIVGAVKATKRKVSKFNKAVSKGMATVKASTSYGKKGTISNSKKAFKAVTTTASKINKGAKIAKSGIIRKIGLAIKGILK